MNQNVISYTPDDEYWYQNDIVPTNNKSNKQDLNAQKQNKFQKAGNDLYNSKNNYNIHSGHYNQYLNSPNNSQRNYLNNNSNSNYSYKDPYSNNKGSSVNKLKNMANNNLMTNNYSNQNGYHLNNNNNFNNSYSKKY